jgi:hypothetical protein
MKINILTRTPSAFVLTGFCSAALALVPYGTMRVDAVSGYAGNYYQQSVDSMKDFIMNINPYISIQ